MEIDFQKCELASFGCEMNDSRYRLVVQRSPKKEDGEVVTDMFGTVYVYRAIITNDWKMSDKDVVLFYLAADLRLLKIHTEPQAKLE